jgi:hypothetical protein
MHERERALSAPPGRTIARRTAAFGVALTTVIALAGCGKAASGQSSASAVEPIPTVSKTGPVAAAPATATRNTTRLGGADELADAAAVARASYPGLTADTRPQAVVVAEAKDWSAALASSALASAPLGAPLLYAEAGKLPPVSMRALSALHPTGASALGGAQLLLLGPSLEGPSGYRARGTSSGDPYSLAVSLARLLAVIRGTTPRRVIVVAADGPPALAMPAAGLAAESGAPILFVTRTRVPAPTAAELQSLGRPTIYTVGSSAIDAGVIARLGDYGSVKPVEASPGEDATAAGNAVAVSRFADGSFGWGIREPGHGLVFANASRPFDAPAAAILSATGDYAPLLLLEDANSVPTPLRSYLSDIQPAAPGSQPVKGIYNHGWLIGDESAISGLTQAKLDAMLEIAPHSISARENTQTSEEPPVASSE